MYNHILICVLVLETNKGYFVVKKLMRNACKYLSFC